MKAPHLLALSAALAAAIAAVALLAATDAAAQQRAVGGPRITLPSHGHHFSWERGHGFRGGFFVVEREVPVIVEREVVREVKVAEPVAANSGTPNTEVPNLPRKPFAVGATYASLPGGCMKLIEEAVSYYYCGGSEWYRQMGAGRAAQYRAIAKP